MANQAPLEIIVAPFQVYITTGGDAFPAVTAAPSGGWTLLGTNGNRNMAEGGVTIQHSQTLGYVRTEGHTGPVKAYRTQEDQSITFTLYDLSHAVYKHVLSGDLPASETIGLSRGVDTVREVSLLVRGASAASTSLNSQFEINRAVQSGSPSVVLSKTGPAGLEFEFMTLDHMSASTTGERFGRYIVDG